MSGCNSGMPRLWRIAIDSTPLSNIADSGCYVDKQRRRHRQHDHEHRRDNFRARVEWVMWDGDTGTDGEIKQYLDIGSKSIGSAEAPAITVTALIEGNATDKQFTGQRNEVRQSLPGARQREPSHADHHHVDDYGLSPTGTVRLDARYVCAAGADRARPARRLTASAAPRS